MILISGCGKKNDKVVEKRIEGKPMAEIEDETMKGPAVVGLKTSMGDIIIELDEEKTPVTTANFLRYVEEGFYDGTIFHRVINNFMIQGGGLTADMQRKPTHSPIVNEASNGLKNNRGTIAMARTNNPNSATSQFFINQVDNNYLNFVEGRSPGYTVFGKVIEGLDVVDKIANVKITIRNGMRDVPVEPVVIKSAKLIN
jgi:cyclophilin family peptidyl-prolyl cis-trans isomerase